MTPSLKKGDPTNAARLDPFVCLVNGLPSFITRWTQNVGKLAGAQGTSGRRVTLLHGTTFLNINGTLGSYAFKKYVESIKFIFFFSI